MPERDHDLVREIARPKASAEHPTTKPVELVLRSLLLSSRRGDTVLDPFPGSGSTIIAAETIGRRCLAVELDPATPRLPSSDGLLRLLLRDRPQDRRGTG